MPEAMAVLTNGSVVLGDKQAKYFALCICSAAKSYVKNHRAEYEEWLLEQQSKGAV